MDEKISSAAQAIADVQDGAVIAINGFIMAGCADELLYALAERYRKEGHPKDLTLVLITSAGDGAGRGADRLALPGMIRRIISSHYSFLPQIQKLIFSNEIEAYDFPRAL